MAFFSKILLAWYEDYGRTLPWRDTRDPYLIWISEIILQQTRIVQGMSYYLRFVERFPDVYALAAADEDEVLKYWEGLGYYSRARNLHAAARDIVGRFAGHFPEEHKDVLSLKGIGEYTAAAICSFAWKQPYAVVDGNVYRVLSRFFGIEHPIDSHAGKKYFASLAQELLDSSNPDLYNQAIMDFGALQCVPKSPDCEKCPLCDRCVAYAQGEVSHFPVKTGKTEVKPRYFNYLCILHEDSLLLSQRKEKDIWQNLYEFPLIETPEAFKPEELMRHESFKKLFSLQDGFRLLRTDRMPKHQLSHRTIYACFYLLEVDHLTPALKDYLPVKRNELHRYAFPRLISLYMEKV